MKEPKSLRDVIKEALGYDWTPAIEDKLFWPLAEFCDHACNYTREETQRKMREAAGLVEV